VYILNAVGNAANGAVSATRLGLKTAIVTNLGDDQNGRDCLEEFKRNGVDTSFVKIHSGIKTNYHYVLWYESERTILTKHEKYPYELPDIGEPKWIYFSSVSTSAYPFHNTVADYLDSHPNTKLAFQPGKNEIALGKDTLSRLYTHADLFFCNVEEAEKILGIETLGIKELLTRIHGLGPKTVVITDGPKGAYAFDGTTYWSICIYPDQKPPYDRTGAGDAFASTITAATILGKTLPEALAWGGINSMSVVQEVGAQKGLLTKEALEKYLASAPSEYKVKELA
jgi:ribokinase